MEEFSRRLQDLRLAKGWNQSDLAREIWGEMPNAKGHMVARNRDRISQYEQGKSIPDPENMACLAETLGVTVDFLAPKVTAAVVDREKPELQMTVIRGHEDKVHLVVNQLLSKETAGRIVAILMASEGV